MTHHIIQFAVAQLFVAVFAIGGYRGGNSVSNQPALKQPPSTSDNAENGLDAEVAALIEKLDSEVWQGMTISLFMVI
jgi:hypothetical protein